MAGFSLWTAHEEQTSQFIFQLNISDNDFLTANEKITLKEPVTSVYTYK